MHKQIERHIKELFMNALDTPEGRELCYELIDSAKARYDEETQRGKLPSEAYEIAIGAIGDVDELLKSCRIKRRKFTFAFWLTAALFALTAADLILMALKHRAYVPLAIGLTALILCGTLALILIKRAACRRQFKTPLKRLAVAGIVLFGVVAAFAYRAAESLYPIQHHSFDAEKDSVQSIEIIRVTHPEELLADGRYSGGFDYETLLEVDRKDWPDLLKSLGELVFYRNTKQELLEYGDICVKIVYDSDHQFLYSSRCASRWSNFDNAPLYNYENCDKEEYDAIIASFWR